ncbi:MAG: type V CRISPR-associated protein C2c8 [Nostoc sp.]|uniref:type V CRISPR-associated protein C2c8 n=1 Tax=Nostoc sp. TaxID=1180 RepID=UPI002FF6F39E
MLTLEFKANFSPDQQAKIEQWLEINRSLWNIGLAALEGWDDFYGYYIKDNKEYARCCPVPYEYRPLKEEEIATITQQERISGQKYLAPFCRILSEQSRWHVKKMPTYKVPTPAEKKDSWGWLPSSHNEDRKYSNCTGYSCPIPRYGSVQNPSWYEPVIRNPTYKGSGGLSLVSKTENLPQWMKNSDIPQRFRAGEMGQLDTAWQEYLKSRYGQSEVKRGKPQYKRKGDKLQTLINTNLSSEKLVGKNILAGIPKLGVVRCKGLDKRWRNPDGSVPRIATYKICKRPDAYYIQLSGELQRSFSVKTTNASVGIDPGLQYELSLSDGTRIKPQKFYRKSEERRTKLQQKLAKKLTERLILWVHHPTRTIQEIRKNFFSISNENYEALRTSKTEAEMIKAIGASRFNTLKYNIVPDAPPKLKDKNPFSGANQKSLEKTIRKLDRKISLQRRNHDQKITTMIVRNYGFIAVEDGLQDEKLRKRTKPKERENGQGYEQTGAKRKSGLSKSLADASPGRKIALLKQKSEKAGRIFNQHPAPYTTKECPVCGSMNEASYEVNDEGDRYYQCTNCGWKCDRDVNSGINIELAQFGNNPHAVLSENAIRARFANSVWEISNPEVTKKPRWKKSEKNKKKR